MSDVEEQNISEQQFQYEEAKELYDSSSFDDVLKARKQFKELGGYRDSKEMADKCSERIAMLKTNSLIDNISGGKYVPDPGFEGAVVSRAPKKSVKKALLVFALIAVIAAGVAAYLFLSVPSLDSLELTEGQKVNSISYRIPKECNLEDSKPGTYYFYSLKKAGKIFGAIEIMYRGENDLKGECGYDDNNTEHNTAQKAMDMIPDVTGVYKNINAGTSVFEVVVYCNTDETEGNEELLSAIVDSFDIAGYSNPRTSLGLKYSYTGDSSAGVKIDNQTEGLSIYEQFHTALGNGDKTLPYYVVEPVKLKKGKTSEVEINISGEVYTLEIECTD